MGDKQPAVGGIHSLLVEQFGPHGVGLSKSRIKIQHPIACSGVSCFEPEFRTQQRDFLETAAKGSGTHKESDRPLEVSVYRIGGGMLREEIGTDSRK